MNRIASSLRLKKKNDPSEKLADNGIHDLGVKNLTQISFPIPVEGSIQDSERSNEIAECGLYSIGLLPRISSTHKLKPKSPIYQFSSTMRKEENHQSDIRKPANENVDHRPEQESDGTAHHQQTGEPGSYHSELDEADKNPGWSIVLASKTCADGIQETITDRVCWSSQPKSQWPIGTTEERKVETHQLTKESYKHILNKKIHQAQKISESDLRQIMFSNKNSPLSIKPILKAPGSKKPAFRIFDCSELVVTSFEMTKTPEELTKRVTFSHNKLVRIYRKQSSTQFTQ